RPIGSNPFFPRETSCTRRRSEGSAWDFRERHSTMRGRTSRRRPSHTSTSHRRLGPGSGGRSAHPGYRPDDVWWPALRARNHGRKARSAARSFYLLLCNREVGPHVLNRALGHERGAFEVICAFKGETNTDCGHCATDEEQ